VVCVRGVDVFGVAIRCVFKSDEDEDGGARGVRGCGEGARDCVFNGAAHAFVVISWVCDIGVMPCVRGVSTARN
jgi:hypothetical protein